MYKYKTDIRELKKKIDNKLYIKNDIGLETITNKELLLFAMYNNYIKKK